MHIYFTFHILHVIDIGQVQIPSVDSRQSVDSIQCYSEWLDQADNKHVCHSPQLPNVH